MQRLENLVTKASSAMEPAKILTTDEQEVERVMTICKACRYCEGFCAVLPAMAHLLEFSKADIHYPADVSHNCGACQHSCQHAPAHEFAVNVPRALALARVQTYAEYAWPPALGVLYRRAGLTLWLSFAAGLSLFLMLALSMTGRLFHEPLNGNFHATFPHSVLTTIFSAALLYGIFALGKGAQEFWRGMSSPGMSPHDVAPVSLQTASDALILIYLDGDHGLGCNDESDRYSLWRRRFYHFTYYGSILCFAATSIVTLYNFLLARPAPYPPTILPVVLGSAGGTGLLIGPAGLLHLNLRRSELHGDPGQRSMDRGFIGLLPAIGATGLLLLILRDTGVMAIWLAFPLGCVMTLFITMRYGKYSHGIYRCAALLNNILDKRTAPSS